MVHVIYSNKTSFSSIQYINDNVIERSDLVHETSMERFKKLCNCSFYNYNNNISIYYCIYIRRHVQASFCTIYKCNNSGVYVLFHPKKTNEK